jgi:serpin B
MTGFLKLIPKRLSRDRELKSDAYPSEATSPPSAASFAENNNDFAFSLYRQFNQKPGNLFLSPFSIRTALATAYAGARGETAQQMSEALRFPPSDEALHMALCAIIERLKAPDDSNFELTIANSLWSQEGSPLLSDFLEIISRHYRGVLHSTDFHNSPELAHKTINRWVEEQTKQRIHDLIPMGGINTWTRLVLANAVYFKGLWELKFDKLETRDRPFHINLARKVRSPLMHKQTCVRHMETLSFQAVDLDYQDCDLSMLVLLPKRWYALRLLERRLSARMIHDCLTQLRVREIKLFIPRFKMTWDSVEIGERLRQLGMQLPFDTRRADFSGIDGIEPPNEESLFISAIFHKAFVEVNEEGTEAAAATAMAVEFSSRRQILPEWIPVFRADHPFLFAIHVRMSGTILFLGRVSNPARLD